ncbi:MAG: c-type cytochrome [Planctomycetia bacterium]|nr:c-type cytochrome [Planctomycetia bacterium]
MAFNRISFAAILASLMFVLAWTVLNWSCAPARAEPRPVIASTGTDTAPGRDDDKELLERGKELFTREWIVGDRRSHAGDGLGPVYNAQSCAACHRLGGIGGAGNNETNVSLVTVFVSEKFTGFAISGVLPQHPLPPGDARTKIVRDASGREFELAMPSQDELAKIHPILRTQPSFPFHRFGVGPEFAQWKVSIFPKDETKTERFNKQGSNRRHCEVTDSGMLTLIESKRNTPPLFGAGLINAIPDNVLEAVAADQAKASAGASSAFRRGDEVLPVRGRVARLKDGRAGRFGWKATVANLREFTLQACSSELGLEVPGFARAAPPWKSDYKAPGIDLTSAQCDTLTRFVASLPGPGVRLADSTEEFGEIERGRELFASVGCAVCHRPNLGIVEGIYSDLLLHNMGHELSDSGSYTVLEPQIAAKDKARQPRAANELEWRTPPLWGLRDSAPYLHDGRAATVADAVALHGGEGRSAAQEYKRLSEKEREQVELFLNTLTAPAMAP